MNYHFLLGCWTFSLYIFIGVIYLIEKLSLCVKELCISLRFILWESTELCLWQLLRGRIASSLCDCFNIYPFVVPRFWVFVRRTFVHSEFALLF